ncbi:MAG: antibiotic biosynthesis monooxygenase [Dysgonomonas sp.]|jgi:quinol monooxygenase YgiN|nr:antibiotic biosynthesis monooxygenase [Prevotella sp.]MDR3060240.1 antibiotic biosynthesis monooxygenase [Prevotella sp.]
MKKIVFAILCALLFMAGCNPKTQNTDNTIVIKNDMVEERTGDELKIVAIMTVKPEAVEDILSVFQPLVQGSQEEDGCIFYNLHQDISDPTKFIMLEEWKSQAAIDFHNNTEHYKAFKEASKDMIVKSEVSVMKLVY